MKTRWMSTVTEAIQVIRRWTYIDDEIENDLTFLRTTRSGRRITVMNVIAKCFSSET